MSSTKKKPGDAAGTPAMAAVPRPVTLAWIRAAAAPPKASPDDTTEHFRAHLAQIAGVRAALEGRLAAIIGELREATDETLDALVKEQNAVEWGLRALPDWEENTSDMLRSADDREQRAADDRLLAAMLDEGGAPFTADALAYDKAIRDLATIAGRNQRRARRFEELRARLHDASRAADLSLESADREHTALRVQFLAAIGGRGHGRGTQLQSLGGEVLFDAVHRPFGPDDDDWQAEKRRDREYRENASSGARANVPA